MHMKMQNALPTSRKHKRGAKKQQQQKQQQH